jgi:hypothetical protein
MIFARCYQESPDATSPETDVFDLPSVTIEMESHEREPLAGIPRARNRMRCDYLGRVQSRERRRERLKQRLIAFYSF